jgi:hypothetical protein
VSDDLKTFSDFILDPEEIRRSRTRRKKTYIIAGDEYMGTGYTMSEFVGTWRELLEYMNGVDDENRDDEETGRRFPSDFDDDELVQMFDGANGDGQQYYTVWCVEERKQVLG